MNMDTSGYYTDYKDLNFNNKAAWQIADIIRTKAHKKHLSSSSSNYKQIKAKEVRDAKPFIPTHLWDEVKRELIMGGFEHDTLE